MSDMIQAADFDSTIDFLHQDLSSVDLTVALTYIDRWENHLQGTDIFQNLMQLKQAILDGHEAEIQNVIRKVSEETALAAKQLNESSSGEIAAKLEQLSQLLAQVNARVTP